MNGNEEKKRFSLLETINTPRFKTWSQRILAVFGALMIWFYVMSNESPTSEKSFQNIKVNLKNASVLASDYGFSVLSGYDAYCDVTLYGKMSDLNRIKSDDITAFVDLASILEPGRSELPVQANLPNGVSMTSSFPERIAVYVDKTTTKTLNVEVFSTFTKSSDITIENPVLNFETVTVSGPEAELSNIRKAVLNVDLGNVTKSIEASGKITLVDNDGFEVQNPYVKCNVNEVIASFDVYKYKNILMTVDTKYGYLTDKNLYTTITPAIVRVRGDPAVVDSLESLSAVTIDEKLMSEDSMTYSVAVKLPDGVEMADGTNDSLIGVSVEVKLTDLMTRAVPVQINDNNVTIIPPENGITYVLLTNKLNVSVRGSYTAMNKISPDDINIVLNLSSYSQAGTFVVPVIVECTDESGDRFVIGSYSMEVLLL